MAHSITFTESSVLTATINEANPGPTVIVNNDAGNHGDLPTILTPVNIMTRSEYSSGYATAITANAISPTPDTDADDTYDITTAPAHIQPISSPLTHKLEWKNLKIQLESRSLMATSPTGTVILTVRSDGDDVLKSFGGTVKSGETLEVDFGSGEEFVLVTGQITVQLEVTANRIGKVYPSSFASITGSMTGNMRIGLDA